MLPNERSTFKPHKRMISHVSPCQNNPQRTPPQCLPIHYPRRSPRPHKTPATSWPPTLLTHLKAMTPNACSALRKPDVKTKGRRTRRGRVASPVTDYVAYITHSQHLHTLSTVDDQHPRSLRTRLEALELRRGASSSTIFIGTRAQMPAMWRVRA
jgi:hypothetical protein